MDPFVVDGVEARWLSRPCSACRCCEKGTLIGVHQHLPREGPAVHRQADRAGHNLRRPGGDRDRERPAVRRGAGATRELSSRCSSRPRPRRCSRSSAGRRANWSRCSRLCWRIAARHLRGQVRHDPPLAKEIDFALSRAYNVPPAFMATRAAPGHRSVPIPSSAHARVHPDQAGVHIEDLLADPALQSKVIRR